MAQFATSQYGNAVWIRDRCSRNDSEVDRIERRPSAKEISKSRGYLKVF